MIRHYHQQDVPYCRTRKCGTGNKGEFMYGKPKLAICILNTAHSKHHSLSAGTFHREVCYKIKLPAQPGGRAGYYSIFRSRVNDTSVFIAWYTAQLCRWQILTYLSLLYYVKRTELIINQTRNLKVFWEKPHCHPS